MRRLAFCTLLSLHSTAATAAVFLVDTTSDDGGAPFQLCDGDAGNGNCSLRGAILRANASSGADTLTFAIPASDPGYVAATAHWRIAPASSLPLIADDLTIDGYSQPGALANTLTPEAGGSNARLKIELHGFGTTSQAGLDVGNGNPRLSLSGLAINNFRINLQLLSPGPHRVEGCFIGTDISGQQGISANANANGIRLRGAAVIGGLVPAARNVIAGNGYIGVWDESATTTTQPSTYQGNLFGLAADGTTVLPGQDYGIYLSGAAEGALIGGSSAGARNLFAGHEVNAIHFTGAAAAANAPSLRIQGNYFGTDWSGTLARPNGALSISQPQPTLQLFRSGRCAAQIGGDGAGEGNLIAHAAAAGVQVSTCTGAAILGNAFRANRIAVDLAPGSNADGATPNDAGDADSGGNRLQNHPVIESLVATGGGMLQLSYRVDSAVANSAYPLRIDLARGRNGQPEAPVLSDSYAAAQAGLSRSVSFPAAALQGQPLVLSATDADGNSSEFHSDWLFADGFGG